MSCLTLQTEILVSNFVWSSLTTVPSLQTEEIDGDAKLSNSFQIWCSDAQHPPPNPSLSPMVSS